MTTDDDEYKKKRPLPPLLMRDVDSFIQANWRLLLFVVIMLFFLIFPFFAPPEVPDFMLMDPR